MTQTEWVRIKPTLADEPTQEDALTEALYLALTAPTDEQAAKASAVGETIASGLTFEQVEGCKAEAMQWAADHWAEGDA